MKKLFIILTIYTISVSCRKGFGPSDQEWGYVTVREGAHMFWWLHKTTADVKNYTERPLIIWLQGGPGSSSCGFGNFAEIGPLDVNLNPRNISWVQHANILFVDNPVGTGFSYVESNDALAKTNRQIALDFVVLLRGIYKVVPELKSVPLYIFSESYGGKMSVEIALAINTAVKESTLEANLVGIGLGDPWISPIDTVLTWGSYLLNLGIVDQNGYEQIQASAVATKAAFDRGRFLKATNLWTSTKNIVSELTKNIDFYNVLNEVVRQKSKFQTIKNFDEVDEKISVLMNGDVRIALGLRDFFDFRSRFVFINLSRDFMKNVTDIVETLLNTTDVKIAVFNGQLDLIVDTPGTIKWVDNLKFPGSNSWKNASRQAFIVNDVVEGYFKESGNLVFYWVNRAGHMIPVENPDAMHYILEQFTNNFSSNNTGN